ncbi:MAG: DnaJ domain-containing protein [Dehalococcoidia bacterium]|jgi:curved DNA-binding protein CbpA
MEERDYYEVLQLHPDAGPTMIAQSYWCLARKYKAAMDVDAFAEHRLAELNRAFEALGSPDLRAAYDCERAAAAQMPPEEPKVTRRVSIEVSFWSLPAWQGVLSAAACLGIAIMALASGAAPWAVLPLAAIAVAASLVTLPSHFASSTEARHHLGPRHWRRDLRVVERLDRNLARGQLAFTPRRR